jgi:hypothetical protein
MWWVALLFHFHVNIQQFLTLLCVESPGCWGIPAGHDPVLSSAKISDLRLPADLRNCTQISKIIRVDGRHSAFERCSCCRKIRKQAVDRIVM